MIEIFTFRLVEGADEAAFVLADARLQTEFFYGQPGLVRRTTARGTDGEWLVVLLWNSEGDADAAVKKYNDDPAVIAFLAMVDSDTLIGKRYQPLD
jgi:hypothetical protein